MRALVLQDIPATTLGVYPEPVHLTASLGVRTLLRLPRALFASRGGFKGAFRAVREQYVLACLDHVGASVVITFVDNSQFFQHLSRIDQRRKYFAIQNGTRHLPCVRDSLPPAPHPASVISMTNLFAFGPRDQDLYARFGHQIDECIPVGTLVGGYYRSEVSAGDVREEYDLCVVSQWHEHFFPGMVGDDFPAEASRRIGSAILGFVSLLRQLIDETGMRVVVCPRHDRDAHEIAFYRKHLGESVTIGTSDRRAFSTYRYVEGSRITVALNSTTLAEVLAWPRKVLWCNATSDEHYEMPEAGIAYFSGHDYASFKERVLELLNMSMDDYAARTRDGARYINAFSPASPPHQVIRQTLLRALQESA